MLTTSNRKPPLRRSDSRWTIQCLARSTLGAPGSNLSPRVGQDGCAACWEAADQQLPETIYPESLRKYFTLTETDLQDVAVCRGVVNKLGFAVQLCTRFSSGPTRPLTTRVSL